MNDENKKYYELKQKKTKKDFHHKQNQAAREYINHSSYSLEVSEVADHLNLKLLIILLCCPILLRWCLHVMSDIGPVFLSFFTGLYTFELPKIEGAIHWMQFFYKKMNIEKKGGGGGERENKKLFLRMNLI